MHVKKRKKSEKGSRKRGTVTLRRAAKKAALELERRREMEQRKLLEQAKMPPSSRYGTNETDNPVTKEQINAILAEKRQELDKVIHDSQTEE